MFSNDIHRLDALNSGGPGRGIGSLKRGCECSSRGCTAGGSQQSLEPAPTGTTALISLIKQGDRRFLMSPKIPLAGAMNQVLKKARIVGLVRLMRVKTLCMEGKLGQERYLWSGV